MNVGIIGSDESEGGITQARPKQLYVTNESASLLLAQSSF